MHTILFLFLCFLFLHVLLNTFKNACNIITPLNVLVVLLHKNGKYSMWNLNFVKLKEIRKKLWIIEFQNGKNSRRIKKWENYFCVCMIVCMISHQLFFGFFACLLPPNSSALTKVCITTIINFCCALVFLPGSSRLLGSIS